LREYSTAAEAFYKAYLLGEGEKDPQLLYFTAVAWFMSGKQDKVINYLQLLFKNHPKNIKLEWREVYVQACLATDQPRQALSCIEILSEESTGSRRLQWQEIRLQQYQSLKMKKKALAYVTKLIDEDPLRVLWWRGLAHFHLSEKHYRQALVALIISGYLEPLDNNGKRLLADLNQFLGIPLEAARYYEMLAQSEVDLELTRRLVDSYRALHRPNRALDWVEQGLLKTSDPALFMIQGELLFELKKYHEAERSFIAAARTPRQAGQAWLMAGYAALNLGEYSRARKNLEAAVKYSKQRQIAEQILLQLDGRL
jgi:predicted Zn-dependent protease